jgi:hypothetical protein
MGEQKSEERHIFFDIAAAFINELPPTIICMVQISHDCTHPQITGTQLARQHQHPPTM